MIWIAFIVCVLGSVWFGHIASRVETTGSVWAFVVATVGLGLISLAFASCAVWLAVGGRA